MNRYVVEGIVAEMAAGRRVLVVAENAKAGRCAFEDVARAVGADIDDRVVVRRANGAERITLPNGGSMIYRSGRTGARGLTADVVFIDDDLDGDQLADLMPVVASTGGQVIRR